MLTPVNPCFLVILSSILLIILLYFRVRSIELIAQAISAGTIISIISSHCSPSSQSFSERIKSFIAIILIYHTLCCPICDLYFFVCPIIESFKMILMRRLTMSSIVVYYIIIISNKLNNVTHYIEFKVVKV